jgi:ribosomal protein S12 methylthiotransferase
MKTFHLISLGCAKNLVDSEVMIGALSDAGLQLVNTTESADILLINTCGFIQPAVEEAVEEILDLVSIKNQYPEKKIVVVGCLVQRYKGQLAIELPEVDLFIGTEGPHMLGRIVNWLEAADDKDRLVLPERYLMTSNTPRVITTPFFRAWLKITEGCDNKCSYCMIPSIRGPLRSRSLNDLVEECKNLEALGVREISIIAQDTSAYGRDLQGDLGLVSLINGLLKQTGIPWIRLLYLYPSGITDDLIQIMSENSRIVPYLDIPLQHVSSDILRRMNRRYSAEGIYSLIHRLRRKLPEIALRTTFLVGFPGETEADLLQIESFLRDVQLDHVGIFSYTNEEGASSEHYEKQIPEEEKIQRRDHLLSVQTGISARLLQKYVGTVQPVLVEGLSNETDLLLEGRTRFQAPDVDGCVYINDGVANPGDIVPVRIIESQVYDLLGGIDNTPTR